MLTTNNPGGKSQNNNRKHTDVDNRVMLVTVSIVEKGLQF